MKYYLKILVVILAVQGSLFALQAPYLLSVKPLSSNTITIKWRNNDISTQGFLVLCKSQSENQFSIKKIVDNNTDSTTDSGLMPKSTYVYAIKSFNGSDTSDISNIDSATTLEGKFVKPVLSVSFDEMKFQNVLTIKDSSEVNRDMYIFKSLDGKDFFALKKIEIRSPLSEKTITVIDSGATTNQWYEYFVKEVSDTDTVISDKQSLFSINYQTMLTPNKDSVLTLGEKLSDFPIKYNAWSMKIGDTILLSEQGIGDNECSVIEISDPSNPKYQGILKTNWPIGTYKYGMSINNTLLALNNSKYSISLTESGLESVIEKFTYSNNDFHLINTVSLVNKEPGWIYQSFRHKPSIPSDSGVFIVSTAEVGMGHTHSFASFYNIYNDSCQWQIPCGRDKCTFQTIYSNNTIFEHVDMYYGTPEVYHIISKNSSTWAVSKQFDISKIPQKVGRFYTFEPEIRNSNNTIIDEDNGLAIVFNPTTMSIYKFNTTNYTKNIRKQSSDKMKFRLNNRGSISQVDIYNCLGKKICTVDGNNQDLVENKLTTYSRGIYFIVYKAGNTIASSKTLIK